MKETETRFVPRDLEPETARALVQLEGALRGVDVALGGIALQGGSPEQRLRALDLLNQARGLIDAALLRWRQVQRAALPGSLEH